MTLPCRTHRTLGLAVAALTILISSTPVSRADEPAAQDSAQQIVMRMIDAHGGLEPWRSAPSIRFDNIFFNPGAAAAQAPPWWVSREVIEPRTRRAYHDWLLDDAQLGWDGERVWTRGWRQANSPTFQALFFFYFLDLPWITQDANVRLGNPETVSVPGLEGEYHAITMTFTEAPAPGKSQRDSFRLFIDQETHLLKAYEYNIGWVPMLRSMQIPEDQIMGPVLRINDTFATIDGFVMPTSMHTTSADGSQTYGYHTILNYSFTEPFDERRLAMPEGAVVDQPTDS